VRPYHKKPYYNKFSWWSDSSEVLEFKPQCHKKKKKKDIIYVKNFSLLKQKGMINLKRLGCLFKVAAE
jgi:hypothetical protein